MRALPTFALVALLGGCTSSAEKTVIAMKAAACRGDAARFMASVDAPSLSWVPMRLADGGIVPGQTALERSLRARGATSHDQLGTELERAAAAKDPLHRNLIVMNANDVGAQGWVRVELAGGDVEIWRFGSTPSGWKLNAISIAQSQSTAQWDPMMSGD